MPAGLYNAMIAPVTRHAIRGAIWYQGESNASPGRASLYHRLFSTMIQDWRRAWGQGDFPFLFVQLANFGKNSPDNSWPELREAQTETLALRNTGMAVTIDIGNPDDIHPTNKQDVGMRLGLAARSVAYGDRMVHSGPIYRQMTVEPGGAVRLWFDHVGSGLAVKGGELKGFVIAGADGRFAPAAARIDEKTVVVSSPEVKEPAAVRYAWDASPEANLYNMAGLPASPFRTDR
jgi:sialate O-acetylesterase